MRSQCCFEKLLLRAYLKRPGRTRSSHYYLSFYKAEVMYAVQGIFLLLVEKTQVQEKYVEN
ncbi:unnamed protein product [Chondrus crispus]|uniref:Uncharacterized protein n=1 Tax=Chondrus crispus TaxID=2769 RepID=R7QHV5_CHOCR|nr:unnamed protein product [Chondrus crispus]CDF37036.1 unnamed protein product [Chondrus crispus]|eukprot:XP_005716855.1 unnamed protein product [Chondrus crispus]